MTDTTKHTVKKLLLKLLMVLLVLAALDVIYYYTLYPKDLAENCTLKALSERATEGVDIVTSTKPPPIGRWTSFIWANRRIIRIAMPTPTSASSAR